MLHKEQREFDSPIIENMSPGSLTPLKTREVPIVA